MSEHAVLSRKKPAPPIVHEVLRSPGRPLDDRTQVFMETRLGHDFSRLPLDVSESGDVQHKLIVNTPGDRFEQEAGRAADEATRRPAGTAPGHSFSKVRVHADGRAAESASAVQALAYTVGQDIVFGAGQYAPGTTSGRQLLAHELAHTVQQGSRLAVQRQEKPGVAEKPARQRIKKIIVYLAESKVDVILEDSSALSGRVTYNGNPDLGTYHITISNGVLTGIPLSGIANERGHVVEWLLQPAGVATLAGVSEYDFVVESVHPAPSKGDGKATDGDDGAAGLQQKAPNGGAKSTQPGEGNQIGGKKKGLGGGPNGVKNSQGVPAEEHAQGSAISQADFSARFDALPEYIKKLSGDKTAYKPEDYEQLLRIAEMMAELSPEDLELFLTLAKGISNDLDLIEQSLKKFKAMLPSLDDDARALLKEWAKYDDVSFKGLTPDQKEAWARKLASMTANAELKKFLANPNEWAKFLVEGVLPPLKGSAAAMKDFTAAVGSGKSGTERAAYFTGGLAKTAGVAAQIAAGLSIVLLLVPGISIGALLLFGLAAGMTALLLTKVESELHIQAAAQSSTLEKFTEHGQKAAAAEATIAIGTSAMIIMAILAAGVAKLWTNYKLRPQTKTAKQLPEETSQAQPPVAEAAGQRPLEESAPASVNPLAEELLNSQSGTDQLHQLGEEAPTATSSGQIITQAAIDEILVKGPKSNQRPSAQALTKAQGNLESGTATSADYEVILQQAVEDYRLMKMANVVLDPTLPVKSLNSQVLEGCCGIGRDTAGVTLAEYAKQSNQKITILRHQTGTIFSDAHWLTGSTPGHAFAIVKFPRESYILDPTFAQFMEPELLPTPDQPVGKFSGTLLRGDPEGMAMAHQLLEKGFIPLTEKNGKLYVKGLGVETSEIAQMSKRLDNPEKAVYTETVGQGVGASNQPHFGSLDIVSKQEMITLYSKTAEQLKAQGDPYRLAPAIEKLLELLRAQ